MVGFELGVLAGFGTACAWSVSCLVHAAASRKLGVHIFLMIRQPMAVIALGMVALFTGQLGLYALAPLLMALVSGLIGIALCDWLFYESVLRIGVRPAQVCQSFNACITAVLGVLFLDEYLGVQGVIGLLTATFGVILVVLAEQRGCTGGSSDPKIRATGIAFALISAFVLACGMILSKEAMRYDIPPVTLAFLRNLAATVMLWSVGACMRRITETVRSAKDNPQVLRWLMLGCVFGPAGGMWLSMVALNNAPAAVATTVIGLQPVVLLIMSGILEKRCPATGSIIGSVVACCGAALVLLR